MPADTGTAFISQAREQLDAQELVKQAIAIAEQIREQAVCASDGTVTWLAYEHADSGDQFTVAPVRFDLYGGSMGIALFLAALEKVTGDDHYHDLITGVVH